MKTNKLAIFLAVVASLLAACGGGGGANSPDRPGATLDTNSLFIRFAGTGNNRNVLAATGNGMISAQMIGLERDGIPPDPQPPERNVTANTTWSIDDSPQLGNPAIAEVADEIRNAGGTIGNVIDILSKVRLSSNDTDKVLTLRGRHSSGTERTAAFTVRPPIKNGDPFISGPSVIALDPVNDTPIPDALYQFLQPLQQVSQPENLTKTVRFCSNNTAMAFNAPQPPTTDFAPAKITNPFLATDVDTPVVVTIYAIEEKKPNGQLYTCADINTADTDPNTDGVQAFVPKAQKIVQLIPGVVAPNGVAICGIINPEDDACSTTGEFDETKYLSACKGLALPSIDVPAGETVQMVAKLTYTNPQNPAQPPFVDYRCAAASRLSWAANPSTIFITPPGLNSSSGAGALISRTAFQAIADTNPKSVVTGSFNNQNGTANAIVSDTLTLNLVDSLVTDIEIIRTDAAAANDPNGPDTDTLFLNILNQPLQYRAQCTFGETNPVVATCTNSCVGWTAGNNNIITANPTVGATTSVSSTNGTAGDTSIKATYTCGTGISDSRNVKAVDDPVVELHLLQVSNGNEVPEVRNVDPFSCVGRTDLVGTLDAGDTYIRGSQQFYAHALFQSQADLLSDQEIANLDPATLPDVTGADSIVFSALPGYANGDGSCTTGTPLPVPEIPGGDDSNPLFSIPVLGGILDSAVGGIIDVLPLPTDELPGGGGAPGLNQTPAASFSADPKGSLASRGLLRLSTVCVQTFIDADSSGGFTDGDQNAEESSTVLVLPAADDELLSFSNELCEILEPALTLGAGTPAGEFLPAGVVVPLIYGVSLIADPVLTQLATNDDGGAIPAEEIISALITGEFSGINDQFPDSPVGLGALTGVVFNGQDDIPGLNVLVDGLDSCALDPLTITVNGLLSALLTLDPDAFGPGAFDPATCASIFDGLGGGGGLPDFPGAPGIPIPGLPMP